MTQPLSDTPIGDSVIPAPVVETVTVVPDAPADVDLIGRTVTLNDGQGGVVTELTEQMALVDGAWQWRENIARFESGPSV